jgi:hypothetical protein
MSGEKREGPKKWDLSPFVRVTLAKNWLGVSGRETKNRLPRPSAPAPISERESDSTTHRGRRRNIGRLDVPSVELGARAPPAHGRCGNPPVTDYGVRAIYRCRAGCSRGLRRPP